MATLTITDLPSNCALDYKAMTAIRGAALGDWVLYAFLPYRPLVGPIQPIVNFYQTNYIADQLNLLTESIDIKNSAPGATISVAALQNAANIIHVVPVSPQP